MSAAIALARDNHVPILVFSIFDNGRFAKVRAPAKGATRSSTQRGSHLPGVRAIPDDSLLKDLGRRMDGALEVLARNSADCAPGGPRPICSIR